MEELRDQVKKVLSSAEIPFTEEQEKAIALMMEDRRQASENLFGELMDFRAGPVQGQQQDRAVAAIQWMHDEFKKRLREYLTPEQLTIWERYDSGGGAAALKLILSQTGTPLTPEQEQEAAPLYSQMAGASDQLLSQRYTDIAALLTEPQRQALIAVNRKNTDSPPSTVVLALRELTKPTGAVAPAVKDLTGGSALKQETQYIRINNNMFTAENGFYEGGGGGVDTEVIQRGGTGAFHGNFSFQFKDESLNARNPFAHNKPPYQERQINFNSSGPLIRNKLTTSISGNQNEQENVGTIHAITPQGPFDLGIVRPFVHRNGNVSGTYQLTDHHSVMFGVNYGFNTRKNQGVGGFTLPERASSGKGSFTGVHLRQFSVFSDRTLYETRLNLSQNHDESKPATDDVSINVLDSFNGGGAQDRHLDDRRNFGIGNLFTRTGQKLTIKAGFNSNFNKIRSFSEYNFLGSYTFSNMDSYLRGVPVTYRETRGTQLLETGQIEMSFFMQNDLKLTQRLTAMFGARYDRQTNLNDHNNIAPRLGFAYAVNRSIVIRGGAGVFYQRIWDFITQTQRRLDGTRQYEIVINNPTYLKPFESGTVTIVPPASVRVTDAHLAAPYELISSISLERTFKNNLFVSGKYEFSRSVHQLRSRDLNAPLPGQTARLDPARGNILNLESTGLARFSVLSASIRQRFSIFNVNFNYYHFSGYSDNDGPFDPPSNNYDLRSDWGRVEMPGHELSSTVNAKLFLGVFLTGTMRANSGGAYNITTGNDDNNDTNVKDRPQGVPRNSGRGPRFLTFNFNISKAFFVGHKPAGNGGQAGSRANVNLFANMTNAFNRTNYGMPSGVMTSPFFGKSNNARPAREIQVGLRFQF